MELSDVQAHARKAAQIDLSALSKEELKERLLETHRKMAEGWNDRAELNRDYTMYSVAIIKRFGNREYERIRREVKNGV